jgi:hypothetical protein
MPKIFNSFDDFNEWFNIPFQEALEKNFPHQSGNIEKAAYSFKAFLLKKNEKRCRNTTSNKVLENYQMCHESQTKVPLRRDDLARKQASQEPVNNRRYDERPDGSKKDLQPSRSFPAKNLIEPPELDPLNRSHRPSHVPETSL